jgi:DNA-directed RNA polymerase sigma subunit (sigma70/sigma32)
LAESRPPGKSPRWPGVDPRDVESIRRAALELISLERAVGEEDRTELGHMIADQQAESPV